jgi:hypothetical protein
MIAGILKICGAWLGKTLDYGKDNPKGFFENRKFLEINRKILRKNKGRWNAPPKIIGYAGEKKNMIKFLVSLPKNRTVVLKDPRSALTFHLWEKLIPENKYRVICIERDNAHIIKSLMKRNNMPIKRALALTNYYKEKIREILLSIPSDRIFICKYDDFFTSEKNNLIHILCLFCDLVIPSKKTTKNINEFIDPKLRHWK